MDDSADSTGENDVDTTHLGSTPSNIASDSGSSFACVEEFQAMGLRPMEFRIGVIRQAMKRSALPLATLHLQHPSGAVERRLAHLVTTGYRLLDPRRREDVIQRMMLGRIHPQLADEVVQVAQSKGQALMAIDSIDDTATGFDSITELLNAQHPSIGLSKKNSRFLADDGLRPWSLSLRSHDLHVHRPLRRVFRTTRQWATKRYLPTGVVIGSLAALWGSWTLFGCNETSTGPGFESLVSQGELASLPLGMVPIMKAVDDDDTVRAKTDSLTGGTASKVAAIALAMRPETAPDKLVVAGDKDPASRQFADTQSVPPADAVWESDSDDDLVAAIEASERRSIAVASQVVRVLQSAAKNVDAMVIVEAIEDTSSRLPLPNATELADSVIAWEQSLLAIGPKDDAARSVASLLFADESESNDQPLKVFASLQGAAFYAVLAGDLPAADLALMRLVETFETALSELALNLASTLVGPLRESEREQVLGDDEIENVVMWLGGFAGRSLVAGKLDHAEGFGSLLAKLAADRQDKPAIEESKDFAKAMEMIRRFEATAVSIESGVLHKVSSSDHFAAGRYWALVRRDWLKAMPHLTLGSDIRLAALASSETLLDGMADPDELSELAKGYLAMASKSKGWLAESYVLHADEILRRETGSRSIASELLIRRLRTQINEEFPSVFALAKRMEIPSPVKDHARGSLDKSPASSVVSGDSDLEIENRGMLSGRICSLGVDAGIELRYEPGVRLTRKVFNQVESKANVTLSKASIELTGVIHVERPTAVAILVSGSTEPDNQSVSIDGHSLASVESRSRDSDAWVYRADLPPGTWTVRWSVSKLHAGLSFQVIDGLSGSPLTVNHPPATSGNEPRRVATRSRVTIASGR